MNEQIDTLNKYKINIVRNISMGLNTLALYPISHPEVYSIIDKIIESLNIYFKTEKEFLLGINIKGWIIKDLNLDKINIQFGASAREVQTRGVSALCFYAGIQKETLVEFLKLMTLSVEEIESHGGIIKLVAEKKMPNINIFEIDFDKLVTDEFSENQNNNLLHDFDNFSKLLEITSIEELNASKSEDIAVSINQAYSTKDKRNIEVAINFVKNIGEECLIDKNNAHDKKDEHAEIFYQLISQINPNFLRQVSNSIKESNSDDQEESENKELQFNNRLFNLLNTFTASNPNLTLEKKTLEKVDKVQTIFEDFSDDHLIQSKMYRSFIQKTIHKTDEIVHSLDQLSVHRNNFLNEMEPTNIKKISVRVILDLMELETSSDDYRDLTKLLKDRLNIVLESLDYELLYEILTFLNRHSLKKNDYEITTIVSNFLEEFFTDKLIYTLIQNWSSPYNEIDNFLDKILLEMNATQLLDVSKTLLDNLLDEMEKMRVCSLIAKRFNSNIDILIQNFNQENSDELYNLILIMERISNDDSFSFLKKFQNHPLKSIRHKVYSVLIKHKTFESFLLIINSLKKIPDALYESAVNNIARYCNQDLLDKLEEFLKEKDYFERFYSKKMSIILAIGRFKNKHAINLLTKVFDSKPFFRKKKNNAFQMSILKSLSQIGTHDALFSLAVLTKRSETFIRLTADTLLEVSDKNV